MSIDYGCGTGELLRYLPKNSIGLEVNIKTVEYCEKEGFKVFKIAKTLPSETLKPFIGKPFKTIIFNHILEHIPKPELFLNNLFGFLSGTDFSRLIVVSPGKRGFFSDKTHEVFIDKNWFKINNFYSYPNVKTVKSYHFPINFLSAGNFFTHNEWHLILDLKK